MRYANILALISLLVFQFYALYVAATGHGISFVGAIWSAGNLWCYVTLILLLWRTRK